MKENYPYAEYRQGDWIVVDDLAEREYAYASDIGYSSEERFEVRDKGICLGRFKTLEDAKTFLESD